MSTNRGNGQHRARHTVQSLGAAVKLFQSPMPSDVHGGRTTKGSNRQDEGGLRKQLVPTPNSHDGTGKRGPGFSASDGHYKPHDLNSFVEMFPTPKASSASPDFAKSDRSATGLSLQTHVALQVGGTLNPDWVEMLMGWPRGWSSLEPMTLEYFAKWTADWPADWEGTTPRVSEGVADRVSRLEAIGDGQIPIVAATAFRVLFHGLKDK